MFATCSIRSSQASRYFWGELSTMTPWEISKVSITKEKDFFWKNIVIFSSSHAFCRSSRPLTTTLKWAGNDSRHHMLPISASMYLITDNSNIFDFLETNKILVWFCPVVYHQCRDETKNIIQSKQCFLWIILSLACLPLSLLCLRRCAGVGGHSVALCVGVEATFDLLWPTEQQPESRPRGQQEHGGKECFHNLSLYSEHFVLSLFFSLNSSSYRCSSK